MTDTREKLVELIDEAAELYPSEVESIADHLIANGVTVAKDNSVTGKWIPVTERMPEKSCYCLCYWKGYTCRCKYWRQSQRFEFNGREVKVTHWMPLPEPPKGE